MNRELKYIAKQSKISAAVADTVGGDLKERVTALERELVNVNHKLSQTEAIAKRVVDERLAQMQNFMQDAVKVLGRLMNESERHRKIVNEATRGK